MNEKKMYCKQMCTLVVSIYLLLLHNTKKKKNYKVNKHCRMQNCTVHAGEWGVGKHYTSTKHDIVARINFT